jgi:hypothetical protein
MLLRIVMNAFPHNSGQREKLSDGDIMALKNLYPYMGVICSQNMTPISFVALRVGDNCRKIGIQCRNKKLKRRAYKIRNGNQSQREKGTLFSRTNQLITILIAAVKAE